MRPWSPGFLLSPDSVSFPQPSCHPASGSTSSATLFARYYEFRNIIILATCFHDIEFQARSLHRPAPNHGILNIPATLYTRGAISRATLPRVAVNAGNYTAGFTVSFASEFVSGRQAAPLARDGGTHYIFRIKEKKRNRSKVSFRKRRSFERGELASGTLFLVSSQPHARFTLRNKLPLKVNLSPSKWNSQPVSFRRDTVYLSLSMKTFFLVQAARKKEDVSPLLRRDVCTLKFKKAALSRRLSVAPPLSPSSVSLSLRVGNLASAIGVQSLKSCTLFEAPGKSWKALPPSASLRTVVALSLSLASLSSKIVRINFI